MQLAGTIVYNILPLQNILHSLQPHGIYHVIYHVIPSAMVLMSKTGTTVCKIASYTISLRNS